MNLVNKFTAAIVATVIVATTTLTTAPLAHAEVGAELERATRVLRAQATPSAIALERALRLSYSSSSAHQDVRQKGIELLGHLQSARTPLIEAGLRIVESDYDNYFGVAIEYYRLLERLLIAKEAAFGATLERPLSHIDASTLNNLRLTVPTRAAELFRAAFIAQVRTGTTPTNDQLPDLVFRSAQTADTSTLEFSGDARQRFGLSALETYPSTALANDRLRMFGMGMTLNFMANIERLLPHNERPGFSAPNTLNAADQAFLNLKIEDAHDMVAESDFRTSFLTNIIPMLLQTVDYNEGTEFSRAVDNLKRQVLQNFPGFVDQDKTSFWAQQGIDNVVSYALRDLVIHENSRQALFIDLMQSSDSFNKLGGASLKNVLRHIMVGTHGKMLARIIGCFYFRDLAGEASSCLGGVTQEQIFVNENGWTTESLTQLNTVITSFLYEQYANIPDSVVAEQQRLKEISGHVGTVEARDRLVQSLIQGSLVLENIDRALFNIATESNRTLEDEMIVAARSPRMQTIINPIHMGNAPINPAFAMLALAKANFIQNEMPVPEWYGGVLAQIAMRVSHRNATTEIKQRLHALLYSNNNIGLELSGKLERISTLLGNVSSQLHASPEAMAAAGEQCSEDFGLFSCLYATTTWLGRTITDFYNSKDPRVSGIITIPDNDVLAQIKQIRRSIQPNLRESNVSLEQLLAEVKNRTASDTPAHQIAVLFEELLLFAKTYKTDSLTNLITQAFNGLVDHSNALPFAILYSGVNDFNRFLTNNSNIVSALFLDKAARDMQLREALRYRLAYNAYVNLNIQSLELSMPGLFEQTPIPSFVHGYNENTTTIPLYKVFSALHRASNTPQVRQVVEGAMAQARQLRSSTLEEGLRTPVAGLDLHATLSGALQGSIAPAFQFWFGLFSSMNTSPRNVPAAWWPRNITLADALTPAVDRRRPALCEVNERTQNPRLLAQCTEMFRTTRVLASAFIKPYLLAAHERSRTLVEGLADTGRRFAMARADRALEAMNSELNGTMVVDGVDQQFLRDQQHEQWLESTVDRLSAINRRLFGMFMGTQMIPQSSIPQSFHFGSGLVLFGFSMAEVGATGFLANSYRNSYLEMHELAATQILPGTLVSGNSTITMRDRFLSKAQTLQQRLPMDAIWAMGIGQMTFSAASNWLAARPSRSTSVTNGRSWSWGGRRGSGAGGSAGQARDYAGPSSSRSRRPEPSTQDYQTLGLNVGEANWQAVRSNYRRLALRYHPDHNPGDATAATNFRRVTAAYERIQGHLQSRGLWDTAPSAAERPSAQSGTQASARPATRPATRQNDRHPNVRFETSRQHTNESFYALDIQPGTTRAQAQRIYRDLEARRATAETQVRQDIEAKRAEIHTLEAMPAADGAWVARVRSGQSTGRTAANDPVVREQQLSAARTRLQELQNRLDMLEQGRTILRDHWTRVNTEFTTAGRNRRASELMERPGQRELEAAFLRVGAGRGETFMQIEVKYHEAMNRILLDMPVGQRAAAIEALNGHMTVIREYFGRLRTTAGIETVDLVVPAWVERLQTPTNRRLSRPAAGLLGPGQ